ncbi:3-hydroxyacyl-CoA dehydrogenase family protein [Pseudactinotalea sp. Z1732]|uniref:3-hydroxyacyl-CoA dehydrogenase family protein n=1 Tax=Micrococcales TaxID=85006 RepID=UPI003C7B6533
MQPITRAGVVGLGTMGRRIAGMLVRSGVTVRVFDIAGVPAELGSTDRAELEVAGSIEECAVDADIVFESTFESLEVKQEVLAAISGATDTVIASNTSTFRPSVLATFVQRPERFLLTHFFNPADVVPLVEVIRAPTTAEVHVQAVLDLLSRLGKRPVAVGEVEGFIANRLQAGVLREAFSLVARGIASPEDVDAVMRYGLGPRWAIAGPIGIADLGGLDVWEAVCAEIFPTLDNADAPPASLVEHVRAGRLGAKSGSGFYDYADGRDQRLVASIQDLFTHLDAAAADG